MFNEPISQPGVTTPGAVPVTRTDCGPNPLKCISWTAILVGAFVAVGLGFLLHLFTMGLSLSAYTTDSSGLVTLAVGAFVWLIISSYIAMFVAGWVSGLLARICCTQPCLGLLHGFSAWCVALVVTLFLSAHMGLAASNTATKADDNVNWQTSVGLINNENSPAVVTNDQAAEPGKPAKSTDATVNVKKATNDLGIGVLATFFIFLVGALGSCFGGYFGIRSACCNREKDYPRRD